MSLKQVVSSVLSQISTINSIAFIPLLNSLKDLKTIRQAASFLKKTQLPTQNSFSLSFLMEVPIPSSYYLEFLMVMVLFVYIQLVKSH